MKKIEPERLRFVLTKTDNAFGARLMLATMRGDKEAFDQVLNEVFVDSESGQNPGAVAALVFALVDFGVNVAGVIQGMTGESAETSLEKALLSLPDQPEG